MKKHIYLITFFSLLSTFSCSDENLGSSKYYTENPFEGYVDYSKETTLKDTKGWLTDTIGTGYIWYQFSGFYQGQNATQNVNVLELDLNNPEYKIEFVYVDVGDSLSSVGMSRDAIAGINGTYELDASFVKTNGVINSQVTIDKDHLRFWKHEGAIFFDGRSTASIVYGTNDDYLNNTSLNILSGAPMLIDEFKPVGENFIGDVSGIDITSLDGEDYRHHQGVRHPRTAVAVTGGGKLLMMTVDGRRTEAAGMTAREMTQFFKKYFDPRSALNIDGGGSTTMWIKDKGNPVNGVVNYPTDNKKSDNFGQRKVRTFILIKKVSNEANFADGTGTQFDPYIIKTPRHLENMRNVDWSDAVNNPLYFKLEADIDMVGRMWEPLNTTGPSYERHLHFDGNGHVIKNLTSKGFTYSSLFGVLCGSCKNLGVINADIDTKGGGGGVIAGYAGLKGPGAPTGTIDNCYTSGVVRGVDIVGGIVGNIGKENGNAFSAVRNCYSTATVIATAPAVQARAGGIVGIVWAKGVIANCYSTGTIISENFGAGGIAAWSDSDIISCVALNKSITNKGNGRIGRVGGYMGKVVSVAQGVNCWGLENMEMWNLGTQITEDKLVTGTLTAAGPYDGESKSKTFLQNPSNYSTILGWKLTGTDQIWSGSFNSKGYPIFKWLEDRGGNYESLDGHNN